MVYKWYILPFGGLYATYHLLREPKTTIEIMCALPPSTWTFNCCCTVSGMAPSTCSPVNDWASWSELYLWLKVGCKIFFVLCESFYVYMRDHTTSTLPLSHQLYQHKNIYTYLQFHPFLMFFSTLEKTCSNKKAKQGEIWEPPLEILKQTTSNLTMF